MTTALALTGTEATDLLASLCEFDASDKDAMGDANQNDLWPEISLNRTSPVIDVTMGDQTLLSVDTIYLALALTTGSRALFLPQGHPQNGEINYPLCSTGLEDVGVFNPDTCKGSWIVNEFVEPPYPLTDATGEKLNFANGDRVQVDCNRCQWNQFGSKAKLSGQPSQAKACGERRIFFSNVMQKGPQLPTSNRRELYAFNFDPEIPQVCRFGLSLGSHKAIISDILILAASMNIPLSSIVLRCKNEIVDKGGGVSIPTLKFEFAGLLTKQTKELQRANKEAIAEFRKRNGRRVSEILPAF